MASLTYREGMALLDSLTRKEHAYRRRRAAEIQAAGGTLAEMIRTPLEEIAAARAKEVRQ